MSKKAAKKGSNKQTRKGEAVQVPQDQSIEIRSASIKDDFCHYGYLIKFLGGSDEIPNRKGHGIVDPDMHKAFEKLNAHMAFKDDVFKHAGLDVDNIDDMHDSPMADLYTVTGFKIRGKEENESVVLIGSKFLTTGGRMELCTPAMDLHSASYQWYNELRDAVNHARAEVFQYMNGKYTEVQTEPEPVKDPAQLDAFEKEEETEKHNFSDAEV